LRIPPSQYWEGIDGSWNTFPLRIGTPEQYTRGFISTASQQTWAVYERACLVNQTDPKNPEQLVQKLDGSCFDSRGRTFNYSTSTSWDNIGFYQLWLEKNIKRVGNGKYGYEKVGLGYTAPEGPTLDNTTVGVLVTDNFWLGHFGINPKSTNFTAFTDPSPSYMSQLFQKKQIPSVSWGYTAGAQYRKTPHGPSLCRANVPQAMTSPWRALLSAATTPHASSPTTSPLGSPQTTSET
jgi:hypothetical protein